MLEFNVELTRLDLKKYVFIRVKSQFVKLLGPALMYLILAVFLLIFSFWFRQVYLVFIVALTLFFMGFFYIYKTFLICKKMFIQGLDLVGKKREFFIDDRCLHILCHSNSEFCGRYFFYDLKSYKFSFDNFFLVFSKNIFIIIPARYLNFVQKQTLFFILNKAKS